MLLCPASSWAQSSVQLRVNDLDGYTRLVFEWDQKTSFEATKSDSTLSIQFNSAVSQNPSNPAGNFRNIGGVTFQNNSNSFIANIAIASDATYRTFSVGSRVMVDVYDSAGTPSTAFAQTAEPNIEEPSQTTQIEDVRTLVAPPSQDRLESNMPAAQQPQVEQEEIAPTAMGRIQPHVITISSTQSVGVTAFERAGFLWIVLDDPSLKIPPKLSGPKTDQFGEFEAFPLDGGLAYRMPFPQNYFVYGEGGGVLWRLVLTPNPRDKQSIVPNVTQLSNILWPAQSISKILELEDPLVGDVIKVVTVNNSDDFIAEKREFVDFEIFSSNVGLAYAPRADALTEKKTAEGLIIEKPNGLAVSPVKDTAPILLQNDIEKETAFFDLEDNPDNVGRLFDFGRWQMGGIRALDKNRQILMNGLGPKSGSARAEDLLTLAKLNIANDRGQEALGLLRVASVALPGIEETPEYTALKGAAEALAGRFEEALEDFLMPTLQEFEEIDYWRAFSLAGLEDWLQADKVVPNDIRPLTTYPSQIKQPIVLALAETALRAGKRDRAQNLLDLLQDDFANMSFARRSAWKYLNGELERQRGNFDTALENWNPLLSGKDDYYRAKAGLSVTRMQLDREKITPEKAIDRLEGLRYAWRGDELESLVNYRLGQVYIENEEFLKGLSVLRNAVSISPNANVTEDITDYMTTTFRDIFTDGQLDNVSPIEAVSIYEEFKELTPIGPEGDLFVQNLAERLVQMDLLGRAGALLEDQVKFRLEGTEKARVATRLGAIRLINDQPEEALATLNLANQALRATGQKDPVMERELKLLGARALSELNRANEAIRILNQLPEDQDALSLRADIAWNSGQWGIAADAFEKLIMLESIEGDQPPEQSEANLILNRAIALNLAGQRTELDDLRQTYELAMQQTNRAQIFELVTRPRALGMLDNRDSISSLISEVDLFGDFLENYRRMN
ncbi:MAG: hypothetical protein AAF549_07025 [Pseudomonadota bacterium]